MSLVELQAAYAATTADLEDTAANLEKFNFTGTAAELAQARSLTEQMNDQQATVNALRAAILALQPAERPYDSIPVPVPVKVF